MIVTIMPSAQQTKIIPLIVHAIQATLGMVHSVKVCNTKTSMHINTMYK